MYPSTYSRRDFFKTTGWTVALGLTSLAVPGGLPVANPARKPNVLFIAVDDLRPQINCYGHNRMISPHLDRLAARGVLFSRCYCQVPVCGASRASLLTGVRPRRNRFVGYNTWADKDLPGHLSLP